jgi:hypothetical protein
LFVKSPPPEVSIDKAPLSPTLATYTIEPNHKQMNENGNSTELHVTSLPVCSGLSWSSTTRSKKGNAKREKKK